MIKQESIDKVFQAVNIVDVIQEFLKLKKTGSNYKALSPFTKENTPSFTVSPSKQIFKCFSSGKGGNAVTFLMEHQKMNFPEAVKYLAEKYHIALEEDEQHKGLSPSEKKARQEKFDTAQKMMSWSAKQYNKFLVNLPADHKAKQEVFEKRMLDDDDIAQWGIGYSPEYSTLLRQTILENGKTELGIQLFLIGDKVDRNFDRIIFPIQDANGQTIGLAGRDLSGNKKAAKFLNPTDTILYKKETTWYGLNFAKESIRKLKYANVVEGYNDVIACHKWGASNTVAGCGTNITRSQIKILKRYTDCVRIVMDNDAHKKDNPGLRASLKLVQMFVTEGFEVEIAELPPGEDPDSLSRVFVSEYKESWEHYELNLNEAFKFVSVDGLIYFAKYHKRNSHGVKALGESLSEISKLVAYVQDNFARDHYAEEVVSIFDRAKGPFLKEVNEHRKKILPVSLKSQRERFRNYSNAKEEDYQIPSVIQRAGLTWEDLKDDIVKYGLIEFMDCFYAQKGDDPPHHFQKVSNFMVEIIQHINSDSDDKSMRLVRCVNDHGVSITFDTLSTDFVEMKSFKRMVESKGNFRFTGVAKDYDRIKHKLYEEMGDGRLIEQLGWQPEGFWALNNSVIIDDEEQQLDSNGCFNFRGRKYYIKSANKIYENMPEKFANQKRCVWFEPKQDIATYFRQVKRVHREHCFNMILHTIGTVFSDLIYDRLDYYPIMFLYGEASTGKDQLIKCCQSLFGKAQAPIKITGKANTDKGKIRKFAEFTNMLVHLSEYKDVNEYIDEDIKAIWDRDGYTRADRESKYLTEEVPILSTCVFTGNYYPTTDSLLTRIVTEEFYKSDFSEDDKQAYHNLSEMIDAGVSGYLKDILKLRQEFATQFREKFKEAYKDLRSDLTNISLPDRMLGNLAVYGAVYKISNASLNLPFSYDEWRIHTVKMLKKQLDKRSTGSVVSHFWDCFIEGCKNKYQPLNHQREYSINGNELFLKFTQVFAKYKKIHYEIFREKGEAKSSILDKLKRSEAFGGSVDSFRFGPESKSSAYRFDLSKLHIKDDLLEHISYREALDKKRAERSMSTSGSDDEGV